MARAKENPARCLAVVNQKGGVAKTTTAINLAAGLARARRKVLLIDMDPQSNATSSMGYDTRQISAGCYEVLMDGVSAEKAILKTSCDVDLLAATPNLAGAAVELNAVAERERRLKSALQDVEANYNYIFIDCPPTLSILTVLSLVAADEVILPVQCEYYALLGLVELMQTIDRLRQTLNPQLKINGILRTMYDRRNKLDREVSQQLAKHYPDCLYRSFIPRNIKVAEAPSHGMPVIQYDKKCSGTMAYTAFTGEFLIREDSA